ncbi:hypothetical protein LCGC14_1879800 [marine sediment metagenome]|uniref:HTH arsR-type domain-containing protein n=1 Tax=marine sediment metagenome TaxID=412755 RepID=A0A0F9IGN0_9ZZZZ
MFYGNTCKSLKMACIIWPFVTNYSHSTIRVPSVALAENVDLIEHDSDIERAAFALKAMSHPLRLKILCAIGEQELAVQDIVDYVGTTQSNVSQHLAKLRDKEILASRRDANRIYYRVKDERTLKLIDMMRDVFCSKGQ